MSPFTGSTFRPMGGIRLAQAPAPSPTPPPAPAPSPAPVPGPVIVPIAPAPVVVTEPPSYGTPLLLVAAIAAGIAAVVMLSKEY